MKFEDTGEESTPEAKFPEQSPRRELRKHIHWKELLEGNQKALASANMIGALRAELRFGGRRRMSKRNRRARIMLKTALKVLFVWACARFLKVE